MMKVIKRAMSSIKPYFQNPRVNDETVKALKKSINRYGFNVPLVLDRDGVLVTGHARYKALLEMGVKDAYVTIADNLTPSQARQYRIVDNKTQEISEWETDKLSLEINEIGTWDTAMAFFDDTQVGEIFNFDTQELHLGGEIEPNDTPPIVEDTQNIVQATGRKILCPFCDCEDVTRIR